jgi:hypothetical protein
MRVKDGRGATELTLPRGVLFTLRRKCGKPSCRCASGEAHESPALAYPAGGRTKTMTLTDQDVARVSAALERYRVAGVPFPRSCTGPARALDCSWSVRTRAGSWVASWKDRSCPR